MKFTKAQKQKLLEQAKKFRALGNLLKLSRKQISPLTSLALGIPLLSKQSKDEVQAQICDGLAEVCELLAEG